MNSRVPTRRAFLQGAGAVLGTSLAGVAPSNSAEPRAGRLDEIRIGGRAITLNAQEHPIVLGGNSGPTPAWLYAPRPFPVFRMKRGEMLDVTLTNRLMEHTSIHWHGIRGPNAMDGVPYVTQKPVLPGAKFTYRFAPPDTGTFFFHPHCDTAQQFGRGLMGVLIVEGDESEAYDEDIVCTLKDWRVAKGGAFLPFVTAQGASRAGSFGTLRTANGFVEPDIRVPAGANVRLRVLNLDSTRVSEVGVMGADAFVIAIDGNPIAPFALDTWRLGPAMRLDLALRTPRSGKIQLMDFFASEPVTLATFTAQGAPKRSGAYRPQPLIMPSRKEPDLKTAVRHEMKLSQSARASDYADAKPIVLPDGSVISVLDALCSTGQTFWALDGKTWPQSGHEHLPPPLLDLKRGESVVIEFANTTSHVHPMHLHGHTFKVLSASKLKRAVHWADTVLVMPDERVQIAFVADNPGNWMIHCHIIEHQDTGMMGWFRVA